MLPVKLFRTPAWLLFKQMHPDLFINDALLLQLAGGDKENEKYKQIRAVVEKGG
ncbi:hypothetical protein GCM10027299_42450 [Larkinella ripae]